MRSAMWLLPVFLLGCTSKQDLITAQGTVEVEETGIVPTVEGRVVKLWVEEGAMVRAGDTLVTLSAYNMPDDIHEREGRVAQAEAELKDLERGARPEELARAEA